jgi:hypothetical protein
MIWNLIKWFLILSDKKKIVDEAVLRPYLRQGIEFTAKFIASNQKCVNEILKRT